MHSIQHPGSHAAFQAVWPPNLVPDSTDGVLPTRCESASQHFSWTNPLPVAVHHKVLVEPFGQSRRFHRGGQNRNIVHSFCCYSELFTHAESLPHFSNPVIIRANPKLKEMFGQVRHPIWLNVELANYATRADGWNVRSWTECTA